MRDQCDIRKEYRMVNRKIRAVLGVKHVREKLHETFSGVASLDLMLGHTLFN